MCVWDGAGTRGGAGPNQPVLDRITWHMTYRTYHDGRLVGEVKVGYAWWVLSEQRLKEELGEHGLGLDRTGPAELGMYLIGREDV